MKKAYLAIKTFIARVKPYIPFVKTTVTEVTNVIQKKVKTLEKIKADQLLIHESQQKKAAKLMDKRLATMNAITEVDNKTSKLAEVLK